MATRKKKTDDVWPKVTVGTHLTVTRYEDGKTELKWDDEALLKEIREACAGKTVKPKRQKKASTGQ